MVWNSTSRKFPLLTDDALALHSQSVSVQYLATFLHEAFSGLPASSFVPNNLSEFFFFFGCAMLLVGS